MFEMTTEKKTENYKETLNAEQKLFCKFFTTRGDTFNSGVLSYAEAYGYELPRRDDGSIDIKSPDYLSCNANAARLRRNPQVIKEIEDRMLDLFNERTVDARLSEIIVAGKDTDSIQGIKIFNDLKQRVSKKVDITTVTRPFASMSDEELRKLAGE